MRSTLHQNTICLMLLVLNDYVSSYQVHQCKTDLDCPSNGYCYKDECSRCVCPTGHRLSSYYDQTKTKQLVCEAHSPPRSYVGSECTSQINCPASSICGDDGTCQCRSSQIPTADGKGCRYADFGETCQSIGGTKCNSQFGLACLGHPELCQCNITHHLPSNWSNFVAQKWDYSKIEGSMFPCVRRAVGEYCYSNIECSGVAGSGAVCNRCGVCECTVPTHVPDVLGSKCGPPIKYKKRCNLHSAAVCDGTIGLQCGTVCDILGGVYENKKCRCSQMHTKWNSTLGACQPKQEKDRCSTDQDCYLIKDYFGYCGDNGRCKKTETPNGHVPFEVHKKCYPKLLDTQIGSSRDFGKPDCTEETVDIDHNYSIDTRNDTSVGMNVNLGTKKFEDLNVTVQIIHPVHNDTTFDILTSQPLSVSSGGCKQYSLFSYTLFVSLREWQNKLLVVNQGTNYRELCVTRDDCTQCYHCYFRPVYDLVAFPNR